MGSDADGDERVAALGTAIDLMAESNAAATVELLPAELNHGTFLSSDFTPNSFLLSRRHTALEDTRAELRAYLADLRTELVGVINQDYEDFIGLGIGLRGTDKRLERMRRPVEGVKQEVQVRWLLVED